MTPWWIFFVIAILLLIYFEVQKSNRSKGANSSPGSLKAQLNIKKIELELKYLEWAEKIKKENQKFDFQAASKDVLRGMLDESVLTIKRFWHNGIPAMREAHQERVNLILDELDMSPETIEKEIADFRAESPEKREAYLLYEEVKEAANNRDGFWIETNLDEMLSHLKKHKIPKPDNFDIFIIEAWRNAIKFSLEQAREAAKSRDKFWLDSHIKEAKEYSKKKRGNLDISSDIKEIKAMFQSPQAA